MDVISPIIDFFNVDFCTAISKDNTNPKDNRVTLVKKKDLGNECIQINKARV
ncbi:MAG: hypothetical protein ACTTJH_03085 [Bacteroidales bacterium]